MQIETSRLPRETKEIFDYLRSGNFLVDNHPDKSQRWLYSICQSTYETLLAYFVPLGYDLIAGEGYFVFYTEMAESAKENRIEQILSMIDIVELFYGTFSGFDVGWRGSPSDLEVILKDDAVMRERLEKMRGIGGSTLHIKCTKAYSKLESFGCLVKTNDGLDTYIITSAFNYVKDFLNALRRIDNGNTDGDLHE